MDEVAVFVAKVAACGSQPEDWQVTKLFGQASARQYFRVVLNSGPPQSFVVMKLPQGFSSPAEEVTKIGPGAPDEFPFLNVQRYLTELGVKVPAVLGHDAEAGLILLQDLGDRPFETYVNSDEGEYFLFFYRKAIDLLVDLQSKTFQNPTRDCVAYHRQFDAELLNWEFDHFLEYGIENFKGVKLTDIDKSEFTEHTRAITHQIRAMPQGFVHRDFQSRNIMVHGFDLYLIDFQDALQGPLLYDLVALLRDSYVLIDQEKLSLLLRYYHDQLPGAHPYAGPFEKLEHDFYLITLQRKLKDFGRFQYINTVKHNPGFLKHMPLTLVYIKLACMELPECTAMQKLIGKYLRELS